MEITIGTIKGRHELPVDCYLIEDSELDFNTAGKVAYTAAEELFSAAESGTTINLYITGLTRVTLAVVAAFTNAAWQRADKKLTLKIWEFNAQIKDYDHTTTYQNSFALHTNSIQTSARICYY
ncbi:MAG: hypothetical protein FH749_07015 [Firmicutes bacterium]|nr:hypothetical protein [Bacillota bacterium]